MDKKVLGVVRDICIITANYLGIMLGLWLSVIIMENTIIEKNYISERSTPIAAMCLIFLMIAHYIYRSTINKAVVQIIVHIVTGLLYIKFMPSGDADLASIAIAVIALTLVSINKRVRNIKESIAHPAFMGAVFIAEYIAAVRQPIDISNMVLIGMVLYLLLFFIQFYINEYFWFLATRTAVNGEIPEKEILRAGKIYTGSFIGVTAAALFLFIDNKNVDLIGSWIIDKILGGIRFVVGNISRLFPHNDADVPLNNPYELQDIIPDELVGEANPGIVSEILFRIITTAILLLLIVLLVRAIYKAAKVIIDGLNKRRSVSEDKEEFIHKDKSEKIVIEKTVSVKDKEGFIFLTPAQKIRKMYRQKVSVVGKNSFDKESKIYEDPSKTIRELETIFGSENLDIIKELTMLYEAARYKENSCSSSDVKRVKEICRIL